MVAAGRPSWATVAATRPPAATGPCGPPTAVEAMETARKESPLPGVLGRAGVAGPPSAGAILCRPRVGVGSLRVPDTAPTMPLAAAAVVKAGAGSVSWGAPWGTCMTPVVSSSTKPTLALCRMMTSRAPKLVKMTGKDIFGTSCVHAFGDGDTMSCEQARGAKHLAQAPPHGSHQDDRGRRRREPRPVCRAENAGDAHRAVAIVQWSPQNRRDAPVRPTDGPYLRQDGVGVVFDDRTAQDNWDRQVVDDEEGHRDDLGARLEPQRDGTASAQPRVLGVPEAYLLFLHRGDHLAEPVRGEGVPADQVGARPRVQDDAERDEGQLVQAKRGHDAVVLKSEKQNFPVPGRGVWRSRGARDDGGVAAKAGTLAPGAPTEAPSQPPPGLCPIGGRVRRDVIPNTTRSGVGVAKGQYRCGDPRRRGDSLG